MPYRSGLFDLTDREQTFDVILVKEIILCINYFRQKTQHIENMSKTQLKLLSRKDLKI
jgi:hypothetical protein